MSLRVFPSLFCLKLNEFRYNSNIAINVFNIIPHKHHTLNYQSLISLAKLPDTLLNVFLAIAVDNLTNAEILTHDEEAEEQEKQIDRLQRILASDTNLHQRAVTLINTLHSQTALNNVDDNADTSVGNSENSNENEEECEQGEEEELYGSSDVDSKNGFRQNGHANGEIPKKAPSLSNIVTTIVTGPKVIIQSPESKRKSPSPSPLYMKALTESALKTPDNHYPFNGQSP